jgi:hypothetical protein
MKDLKKHLDASKGYRHILWHDGEILLG